MRLLDRGYGRLSSFTTVLLAIVAGLMFQVAAHADYPVTNYTSGASDAVLRDFGNSINDATATSLDGLRSFGYDRLPVLQFPISSLPATNEILSATIRLYINSCAQNSPLKFFNTSGTGTVVYESDIENGNNSITLGTINNGTTGWFTLDVTASIQAAKAAGYTWATFYVGPWSSDDNPTISIQAAEGTAALRPNIVTVVKKPTISVLSDAGTGIASDESPSFAKGTFFGTVETGSTQTNTYAITNSGSSALTISSAMATGGDAAQFVVGGVPSTVDAGSVSNFTIAFTPLAEATYTATVSIVNDSFTTPYLINLTGAGSLVAPVATAATSITGTSFVANWDASAGATNYFIDVATNAAFGTADYVAAYSNLSVGGGTSVTVSNLVGRRGYVYRLRAQGTAGTNPTNSNTIMVSLPQNKPVANDDVITILEDSGPVLVNVLTNDVDADLDELLIFSVTAGAGMVTVNPGQLDATWYSPATNWNGADVFYYTVVDGTLPDGFDSAMVTVNVTPVNDMPSFVGGTNSIIVDEDSGAQSSAGWATAISAGPANESSQVLTFIAENDNNGLFSSQPAVSTNGTLTFTPAADSNGVAYVSVRLMDDATAGGGALTTAVQTVRITVNPVNDAPSFTKGADIVVDEDCGPQMSNGWATAISAGPANEPVQSQLFNLGNSDLFVPTPPPMGQQLTFIVENDNNGLFSSSHNPASTGGVKGSIDLFFSGQPAVSSNGTLTFTPADDSNGVANVSVWLVDDNNYGGGAITTAVQTFTITVNAVNDDPVAVTDVVTTPEDTPAVINVVTNDTDVDLDSVLIYSITQGTNGSVVINPGNESVTYTAAVTNWHGSDMFTYVLVDGAGGVATGQVNITVSAVNDMPSFTKGANITVDEDNGAFSSNGWATAIFAGATNESGQVLAFIVKNDNPGLFASLLPLGGKVQYNGGGSGQPAVSSGGGLYFTPADNSNGVANVSVWLVDDATAGGGALTTAVQTCTITINPVQDVPVAVDDSASTDVALPVVINVLANDLDVDGDTLVIDSIVQGTDGVVTVNHDNTLTYSPNPAWTGVDTFEYVIFDQVSGYATGMVTVTVAPKTALDFDGDGVSDLSVFNPMSSTWYLLQSNLGSRQRVLGTSETVPVPADYDGDGRTDLAVYYPSSGTWYIIPSGGGAVRQTVWGWSETIPVPADYDGDGKADVAVYYPGAGTWYIIPSGGGAVRQQVWGWSQTVPVPADYDGDGKTDMAVYNKTNGDWYIIPSGGGAVRMQNWGWNATVPVPADYDGDGRTDLAAYHPASGNWYIIPSGGGAVRVKNWGWSTTIPIPADFDGDGQADLTVYDTATGDWYNIPSGSGTARKQNWGWNMTEPVFNQYQNNLWMGL